MTKAEWSACEEPGRMLVALRGRASDRKLILFSCARLRRICKDREGLVLSTHLRSLAVAEGYADGSISLDALRQGFPCFGMTWALPEDPWRWAGRRCPSDEFHEKLPRPEYAGFLRDIFGNPFRPVVVDPAWRTSTAVAIAQGMYESRDFSAMPILADAIQDAGCANDDILNHCRGDGPHVRGCWVVDMVLGKS